MRSKHSTAAVRSLRSAAIPALIIVVALLGARPNATFAGQGTLAAWVELGPSGQAIARAVTAASECPLVTFDERSERMAERAAPSMPDFPVRVCEARVPAGTARAAADGLSLPLPAQPPERILVIGDTGCRMKGSGSSGQFQACNDPEAWPFARIAARAAEWRPDLIVHTGDYHYREAPCPDGNAGCAGSPWGYNWASWEADFFAPAAPLLRVAPWVMVRGNHEDCTRAADGWFRLLDPGRLPAACPDYTEPYAVTVGDLQLLMLDSSFANDYEVIPDQIDAYRAQFAALHAIAGDNAWLLTHDPLWVFGHAGTDNGEERLFRDNENLQRAAAGLLPSGLRLAVSGHIHVFQTLDFGGDRPPQLVAGMSGTAIDPQLTTPLAGLEIDGMRVAAGRSLSRFGYVTMERNGRDWLTTLRGVNGESIAVCRLAAQRLRCDG
jgi:hypothetical protein